MNDQSPAPAPTERRADRNKLYLSKYGSVNPHTVTARQIHSLLASLGINLSARHSFAKLLIHLLQSFTQGHFLISFIDRIFPTFKSTVARHRDVSNINSPSYPETSAISCANSAIVSSSPFPTFMCTSLAAAEIGFLRARCGTLI